MTAPKLFISYSWTSTEHEDWVLKLAHDLAESGVEVKFDKWDLKEGQDPYHFMEQMVADETITKVIMICDKKYKSRADDREKGVGVETQIISSKISLYTTNFTEPLSYQGSAFLKLPKFP